MLRKIIYWATDGVSLLKKEINYKYENIDVLIIDDIEYLTQNFEEQKQLTIWLDKLYTTYKQIVFW